jgi:hypothetical protein
MWRIVLLVALTTALTVPATLSAGTGDGMLSVKRGRGQIGLRLNGTVIGRLGNGKVQIRDQRPFDGIDPQFTGCKPKLRHPSLGMSVCQGKNIGFRALDSRYGVTVRGSGIFLSAVGRGTVTIDGAGDLGVNDGVMSFNDQPYESLPDDPTTYPLEAPPPGA